LSVNINIRIGAVIPTFNRKHLLANCLESLVNQENEFHTITIIPIIIVDGSSDGTVDMLNLNYPEAIIVMGDGNWWYTHSINEGFKKALELQVDFILTLNDDIYFDKNYLSKILKDYNSTTAGSIIGSPSLSDSMPHIITFSGVKKIDFMLKEYNYISKYSLYSGQVSGLLPSVVLSGRGILYPIQTILKLGFYDEKLIQYKSETDYTFNAYKTGIPVYISFNAPVYEHIKETSAGAIYNNPSFKVFWKSLFNPYSINSIQKTLYYSIKHKGYIMGALVSIVRVCGIIKNFLKVKIKLKR